MNDLISRQAGIDAIRESVSKYTGFMEMEMYTDDDAVEAISGVPSAQQWILCSERLPEAGKYVLRTIKKYGWYGEEYWSVDIGLYNTNDGSIIAWMPLPEPYKEIK